MGVKSTPMTARNKEMFKLWKKGWSLRKLAEKYGISHVTVDGIMKRMSVKS